MPSGAFDWSTTGMSTLEICQIGFPVLFGVIAVIVVWKTRKDWFG